MEQYGVGWIWTLLSLKGSAAWTRRAAGGGNLKNVIGGMILFFSTF